MRSGSCCHYDEGYEDGLSAARMSADSVLAALGRYAQKLDAGFEFNRADEIREAVDDIRRHPSLLFGPFGDEDVERRVLLGVAA
jgi:hypothetical protein